MQDQLTLNYGLCACGCGQQTSTFRWNDSKRGRVKGQHRRYVRGHANRRRADQFVVDVATGCWVWQGGVNPGGYANATFEMRADGFKMAHRWFFAQKHGSCPDTLDHICRNRRCVNPDHLEPCGRGENVRRGDVAILDWDKVAEIRAYSEAHPECSLREVGRRLGASYGVSPSTIKGVLMGVRWPESARPEGGKR